MSISSIDDLLAGGVSSSQPEAPESEYQEAPEEVEELEPDEPDTSDDEAEETDDKEVADKLAEESKVDEYGNQKEPENEAIRERLARQAKKYNTEIEGLRQQLAQQNAAPVVQQAAQDFEYDPNSGGDWQQQLAKFVKQTVQSMNVEQENTNKQQVERQQYQEFQTKFRDGMDRFDDFIEVVSDKPLDDAMTLALRGIADPAAFIYTASKRNPEDLERISKLRDPHARYAEMIRLEERMRRNKPTTKAPKPLNRTVEDTTTKASKKAVDTTGDDLLAKADSTRLSKAVQRHKGHR